LWRELENNLLKVKLVRGEKIEPGKNELRKPAQKQGQKRKRKG
jgi:hypothetical protein